MFASSLPPVVCTMARVLYMSFVFAYAQWCPTHIVLCFCFGFLRLVYPMLSVSLDCPFLIAIQAFSNVYLLYILLVSTIIVCAITIYVIILYLALIMRKYVPGWKTQCTTRSGVRCFFHAGHSFPWSMLSTTLILLLY